MTRPGSHYGLEITRDANADLSANQYYFVKLIDDDTCDLAGANERAIGVLQDKPAEGEACAIRVTGTTICIAAEAIAVGKKVTPTAAGKGEVVDAAGEWYGGIALTAAAADGDEFELLLHPGDSVASDA